MKNLLKKVAIIASLGVLSLVNASELYMFQTGALTSSDGKKASIFVGVPVTVKKDMDKKAEVTIKGYKFDDNNIYSSEGKELIVATIDSDFKVTKKANNEVELNGTIDKEFLTPISTESWEEHEEFYFEMCTQCHAAPKVEHLSMMEWGAIFETMKGFAKLDAEESEYLIRYLKSHANDGLNKIEH
jgi:hypothetical protein